MDGSKTATTSVRLVIQSRIRLIDLVHGAAEQVAGLAGFDESQSLDIGIAVRETVINAITHGNGSDPRRKVDIALEVTDRGFRARVKDEGAGFDPKRARDPTSQENLLENSGRGLLMVRAFVDDVRFRFRKGRGMEVTLVKHLPAPTAKGGGRGEDNGGASA